MDCARASSASEYTHGAIAQPCITVAVPNSCQGGCGQILDVIKKSTDEQSILRMTHSVNSELTYEPPTELTFCQQRVNIEYCPDRSLIDDKQRRRSIPLIVQVQVGALSVAGAVRSNAVGRHDRGTGRLAM